MNRTGHERIVAFLEPIKVKAGSILCWAAQDLHYAYFPVGAVLSVLIVLNNGSAIETAKIGREGAFGLFEAMYTHTSYNQCVVLLGGTIYRLPFNVLRSLFENDAEARALIIQYVEMLTLEIQQAAACFALHPVRARISRWLLTMDDRTEGRDFGVTHEFLACILGINRKSVTLAAQAMQRDYLISYRRGRVRILNRLRLEETCCECYEAMRQRFKCSGSPSSEMSFHDENGPQK